jgi:hypothetical protein
MLRLASSWTKSTGSIAWRMTTMNAVRPCRLLHSESAFCLIFILLFRRHGPATSLCRVQEKCTMREENFVGCLLLIVFLAFPRIALVLLFLFSNYLQRAYHGLILPLLGFLFLPLTTLLYAWMANTRQPIAGINLLILLVTVVIDLGGLGGGEYHRRRRWQD